MTEPNSQSRRDQSVPPYDESGHTLLPMLIGGLVLIVLGAAIVMAFV